MRMRGGSVTMFLSKMIHALGISCFATAIMQLHKQYGYCCPDDVADPTCRGQAHITLC